MSASERLRKRLLEALRFKLNTIDLDDGNERLREVSAFAEKCPDLIFTSAQPSPGGRGWHFTLWCSKECEKCRELFDDRVRYSKDKMRPSYTRNILFTKKEHTTLAENLNIVSPEPTKHLYTSLSLPSDRGTMVRLKVKAPVTEVEEGIHEAVLRSVEKIETSVGPALRWIFALPDGTEVTGITSLRTSPASKLMRWFGALGGRPTNENEINTDDVIGRACLVKVAHRMGKFGGAKFPNVTDVLPSPVKK